LVNIRNRLACPPSFWRSRTQEQIAEVAGISQGRVAQIINNANFGEINNLLSQGRDMAYIDLLKNSRWKTVKMAINEVRKHIERATSPIKKYGITREDLALLVAQKLDIKEQRRFIDILFTDH